mgnify:CR=1 FL=1
MVVTVQFKDKNKVFKGRTYDYLLNKNEEKPVIGSVIRMMDNDYNWLANGTRVKVVDTREKKFTDTNLEEIKYMTATLD